MRRLTRLSASLAVLLCIMTALTLFALVQRKTAVANENLARQNAARADANAQRAIAGETQAKLNARAAAGIRSGRRACHTRRRLTVRREME